jgi:hypothetical protein
VNISPERPRSEAARTRFRPEVLEKSLRLLSLLEALLQHPSLKGRLALKGGTAINLFLFDVPRLSVDIDLNYVGAIEREAMLTDRPRVEQAARAVFEREGLRGRRAPKADEHADGKWLFRYASALGGESNLEVDLNFMFRVPPLEAAGSAISPGRFPQDQLGAGAERSRTRSRQTGRSFLPRSRPRPIRCSPASLNGRPRLRQIAASIRGLRSDESQRLAHDQDRGHRF